MTQSLTTIASSVVNPVLSPASPQAQALADLLVVTLAVCAVIFAVVTGLIALCAVRFRERGSAVDPPQVAGSTKLEVSWTLASILVVVCLFALTVRAMRVSDPPPDREPDLTVIGHQWWWEVRYADGTVTANEIHIPTQADMLVRVEAADVIHSFWVPQLGRKVDAIPGHPNHVWIRADQAGEYLGTCAEFCGAQHAWMRILVVAESPQEFLQWKSHQVLPAKAPETAAAVRGEKIFRARTCVSCHSVRGVGTHVQVGPDLTHLASRQTIGAGVLRNDPASLRGWLTDPQQAKPGSRMPNFHLSDNEVDDLSAFLETLE